MRRKLAFILTFCLMAAILCVSAFAAEESVIKVQYDSQVREFSVFDDGWNYAMETAEKGKEVYVTLLKDWTAEDGQFTDDFINGAGFDWDAIYFAENVNITLDLNGHTIDRGLTVSERNGEVIFINDNAKVTIKNGTITGGYSYNGAGGIHIENANVSLIDLVFTNNRVRDDDGAAIQHNYGGELYMKNCRFENNNCTDNGLDINGTVFLDDVDKVLIEDCYFASNAFIDYGAGIYANGIDDFQIKNSTFQNLNANDRGGAIWVGGNECKLYIYNCIFSGNSAGNWGGAIYSEMAELHVYDSTFTENSSDWDGGAIYLDGSFKHRHMVPSFFYRCTFDKNSAGWDGGAIFCNMGFMTSKATAYGCTFTNNYADDHGGAVFIDSACEFEFYSDEGSGKPGIMKNNTAGIKGGGIYAETSSFARVALGGEIYIKNNTSLGGDDDLYITDGSYVTVYNVTSPEGSIGLRVKNSTVKVAAQFDATVTSPDLKPFFANNKSFELTLGTTRSNTSVGDVNCINMTKASGIASIISEGSPAVIISLAAFALAFAVIVAVVIVKKKKADLETSAEDKDEK